MRIRHMSVIPLVSVLLASCGQQPTPDASSSAPNAETKKIETPSTSAVGRVSKSINGNTFEEYKDLSLDEVKAAVNKIREDIKLNAPAKQADRKNGSIGPQWNQTTSNCSSTMAQGSAGKIYMHRLSGQLFKWRVVMEDPNDYNYYDIETIINDWDINLQLFQKEASGTVLLWYGDKFDLNVLAYWPGISVGGLTCWVTSDDYGN